MALIESAKTQHLINSLLRIEEELDHRRQMIPSSSASNVALRIRYIPHGYYTQDVYAILKEYGPLRSIRWKTDSQGYELNTMIVVWRDSRIVKSILSNGLYRTHKDKAFVKEVKLSATDLTE